MNKRQAGRTKKEMAKEYRAQLRAVLKRASASDGLLDEFLKDLLTPAEYVELGIRWQIVKLLEVGMTHREIANKLKTGISTVTRGARELEDENGGFWKMLK